MKPLLSIIILYTTALCCAALDPTLEQEQQFLSRVESAFRSKDAAALAKLHCLDGANPAWVSMFQSKIIPELLRAEFADASYMPVTAELGQPYNYKGDLYAPNLAPVRALHIRFKKTAPNQMTSTTLLAGIKEDSLRIVVAVKAPSRP